MEASEDMSLSTSGSDSLSTEGNFSNASAKKKRKRKTPSTCSSDESLLNYKTQCAKWQRAYADLSKKYELVVSRLDHLEKQQSVQQQVTQKKTAQKQVTQQQVTQQQLPQHQVPQQQVPQQQVPQQQKPKNQESLQHQAAKQITESRNTSRNERYDGLLKPKIVHATNTAQATTKPVSEKKPSPIFIREKNSKNLMEIIATKIGKNSFFTELKKKGSVEETKLQVNSEDHFRTITKALDELKIQYYTFQLKSDKGLCVVLKGLEHDLPCEEIRVALDDEGFKVKSIINMMNRFKVPQPLFKIELNPEVSTLPKGAVHPIYNLRYLLNRKISVEEPHRKNGPVQCQNCQEFGHSKKYCHLPSVCVICGNKHSTSSCNAKKDDQSAKKCCNCGENHTANYRGCSVYSYLKKKMSETKVGPAITKMPTNIPEAKIKPGLSFADAMKGSPSPSANCRQPELQQPPTNNDNNLLLHTITQLMSSMQQMMQESSRTQAQIMQLLIAKQ